MEAHTRNPRVAKEPVVEPVAEPGPARRHLSRQKSQKAGEGGTSLSFEQLRLCSSSAGYAGLSPGPGTKIPHAVWPKYCFKNGITFLYCLSVGIIPPLSFLRTLAKGTAGFAHLARCPLQWLSCSLTVLFVFTVCLPSWNVELQEQELLSFSSSVPLPLCGSWRVTSTQ